MEISGYPHYENVCSNILGFYFDPDAEHGMGKLLLTAFFNMVGERAKVTGKDDFIVPTIAGPVNITREHPAYDQKRIDLVIDAETFTIGIENKIYHWEANDFENYASVIDSLGINKVVIKAILCLRAGPNDSEPAGGFIRYTYDELWAHVRNLLGHHMLSASTKWTTYLTEFMTTTKRLTGESPEEKEVTDFFMKHREVIERLVHDRQQLLNRLHGRLKIIEEQVKEAPEFAKYRKVRGLCGANILASHFEVLGRTIGMDLVVGMTGWEFQLWDNGSPPYEILHRLAESEPMQKRFSGVKLLGSSTVLQQWDLHADEIQLLQGVTTGYAALIAAADAITSESL